MASGLSSDDVQQLSPLLGSLSRMVVDGSLLSESELKTLMLGSGLSNDLALLNELKLWGRLLSSLYEEPLPELRRATLEALKLRNLPEATVLLAVDTVTSKNKKFPIQSGPLPPANIEVSPDSLDFGTLNPGQPAIKELEVRGGPGQVVVESDQLKATPAQFGAGTTRIRVEAKPMNGGVLWTSLKLIRTADAESLEIPVQAQWSEPSPAVVLPPPAPNTGSLQVDIGGYTLAEGASNVISLAQEEARQSQYNFVGTEHLLLSLLRYHEGVAAKVMANLVSNAYTLEKSVETIIGRGGRTVTGEIGLTPRVKKIMAIANDEARRMNQRSIDTEHLLLGLLLESESIAANLIQGMNVNAEAVRIQIAQVKSRTNRTETASPITQPQRQGWSSAEVEILKQLNRLLNVS